jgi:hypothetical protein
MLQPKIWCLNFSYFIHGHVTTEASLPTSQERHDQPPPAQPSATTCTDLDQALSSRRVNIGTGMWTDAQLSTVI